MEMQLIIHCHLQASIDYENSLYDDEGNFIEYLEPYEKLKKSLMSNSVSYYLESGNINSEVIMVQEFLQEFQVDIKILKGYIEGFKEIWNVHGLRKD